VNPAPRTLADWLAFQQRQHPRSIELGLTRVAAVAGTLGLLRPACPVITVAGTNGKGSTATALAALMHAMGLRTGLFTSPHLLRYTERIRIDGVEIASAPLLAAFEAIEAARGDATLTFFEYNTLAALWCFRDAGCGALVLEVGLGGRLDATNIIDADVAVLCSVGMDHMDWLGDTLDAIGAEKAGIFRAGRPVVLGTPELPGSVWRRIQELGCDPHTAGREFDWRIAPDGRWDYFSSACRLGALPAPALPGAIQYRNVATAIAALQCLPAPQRPAAHCDAAAIGRAVSTLSLPGRLQRVARRAQWLLDVAHNAAAAAVLAAELRVLPAARRTFAVFGALADKDVAAVSHQLDGLIDHWIFCTLTEERGLDAGTLATRCGEFTGTRESADSVAAGCARAEALAHAGDRVLVFGSFHTVGPALAWLGLY